MENISLAGKTNFFERESLIIKKAGVMEKVENKNEKTGLFDQDF